MTTPPPHTIYGAIDYAELERYDLHPDEVIDFSVNSNPYGPAPLVQASVTAVPLDRYPDREGLALRRALAEYHALPPDHFMLGNGAIEVLWLIAFAFLNPGDHVLVIGPTFGEYARTAQMMGATVETWFGYPGQLIFQNPVLRIQATHPRIVFCCNPNNPTGAILPHEMLANWAEAYPETLFVVDEAYINFTEIQRSALVVEVPNVLVVRSLTKDHAIASLRLGYAIGAPELIEQIRQVRLPWNVNGLAQAAGLAALQPESLAHVQSTLSHLHVEKKRLVKQLGFLGLEPEPSQTHYFLLRVGNATRCRHYLLKHGLLVRDCTSYGLPDFIRIATRTPEENGRLLGALKHEIEAARLL